MNMLLYYRRKFKDKKILKISQKMMTKIRIKETAIQENLTSRKVKNNKMKLKKKKLMRIYSAN